NPSIAYFLLMAGFALLVFEFYTAGVGLAGVVGAVAVAGAMVGFSHLPVRWWAFGLLVLATLGFAVDVQAGGLGVWTVIGARAVQGLVLEGEHPERGALDYRERARNRRKRDPAHDLSD